MFVFYFGYYLTTIVAQAAQLIHNFREYLIRHCSGVDVHPGNESASSYALEHLFGILDRLSQRERPTLVRGDCGFGNENWMGALESKNQNYLFKVRQTRGVKELIKMMLLENDWSALSHRWDYCEGKLQARMPKLRWP